MFMPIMRPPGLVNSSGPALLASWDLNAYSSLAEMLSAGWSVGGSSDWDLIDDGGNKALLGTIDYIESPSFRAQQSGELSCRVAYQGKFGNLASGQTILRFVDSYNDTTSQLFMTSVNKCSARRWQADGFSLFIGDTVNGVGVY